MLRISMVFRQQLWNVAQYAKRETCPQQVLSACPHQARTLEIKREGLNGAGWLSDAGYFSRGVGQRSVQVFVVVFA